MIRFLEIAVRLMNAAALFAQPLILYFFSGRWQARGGTFFSVRVDPAFPGSDAGQAIMRTFRRRVWGWTAAAGLAVALFPGDSLRWSRWMFLAFIVVWQGNYFAFALASRSVREQAEPVVPSPLRVASLDVEDRAEPVLALIEWTGMVLPLALPVLTAIALLSTGGPSGHLAPVMLAFYFFVGFLPAQAQYALRYGARASDWAVDPAQSRRYRAYIGLVNTLVFGNIILWGCGMLLFPRYSFWLVAIAWPPVYFALFRVRRWLKLHLAQSSCDPMPDTCWKWGYYYFNPEDSALVVPGRTDISWSPNFARRPIWIGWGAVTVAIVLGLSFILRMTVHSM